MALYKNWPEICNISDQNLKLFVCLSTDDDLLNYCALEAHRFNDYRLKAVGITD